QLPDPGLPETAEPFRDRTDSLASSLGPAGFRNTAQVLESTRSTPNALSEPEAGGQVSNTEDGFAIKEELVSVMQNKLDDAVLEVLTTTLGRNRSCNLTLDDVQFIQKPQREPTLQLYCTVQAQLLPYLQAMMEYLRQDLHNFLYTPKYTDPKPENHFK
ncbi:unnamed protein product, partial [Ixodes pacificus]